MKKITAILLATLTIFMCCFVTGCGCTRVEPKLNTNSLDRIKIFKSNIKEEKGMEIVTLKGGVPNAMGNISQLYAEVKSKNEKPKEDVSKAKKVLFFELLNYTEEGKPKKSNYVYVYYIGSKVYCYYKDKQTFGDGDYYLNGYTNVKQKNFEEMLKQVGDVE